MSPTRHDDSCRSTDERAAPLNLAEQTARRLILAGITWNDPRLQAIREWNASVYERAHPEGTPDD